MKNSYLQYVDLFTLVLHAAISQNIGCFILLRILTFIDLFTLALDAVILFQWISILQGREFAHQFSERIANFLWKNERIMSEWAICSNCSLKRGNEGIAWFFFKLMKKHQKRSKKYHFSQIFLSELLFYHERPEWMAHGRFFDMSNLSDLLTFAHLSWAI